MCAKFNEKSRVILGIDPDFKDGIMKTFTRLGTSGVCFALGTALIAGSLLVTAPDANALGGNCSAWLQNSVGFTYGAGRCSSLNRDTKARVTLDISSAPDYHSSWFTRLNRTYRTPAWSAASHMGWPRSARIDHAKR